MGKDNEETQTGIVSNLIIFYCNRYIFINALIGHNIRNATLREYPAVVAFVELDPNLTIEENIFCTGVFITKSHILTYEHCFDNIENRNFKVIAEHPNIFEGSEYFAMWWTTYDKWAGASNIPQVFNDNDIAMMRINGKTSIYMVPSSLTTVEPQSMFVGHQLQVVGFGRTNTSPRAEVLQTANMNVLSNEECEAQLYQATGVYSKIHPRYLCTSANPHTLLAEGDTGGPLYFQRSLVALHTDTMLNGLPMDHPKSVNLHLGIQWYRNFINYNLAY